MTAVLMADQKTVGETVTPQASGPRLLLSCPLEHPSLVRQCHERDLHSEVHTWPTCV